MSLKSIQQPHSQTIYVQPCVYSKWKFSYKIIEKIRTDTTKKQLPPYPATKKLKGRLYPCSVFPILTWKLERRFGDICIYQISEGERKHLTSPELLQDMRFWFPRQYLNYTCASECTRKVCVSVLCSFKWVVNTHFTLSKHISLLALKSSLGRRGMRWV